MHFIPIDTIYPSVQYYNKKPISLSSIRGDVSAISPLSPCEKGCYEARVEDMFSRLLLQAHLFMGLVF